MFGSSKNFNIPGESNESRVNLVVDVCGRAGIPTPPVLDEMDQVPIKEAIVGIPI